MDTINIGIDLGTTNSLISQFRQGEIEVFKNQTTQHEVLPSAVWIKKDRIFVGEKAYTQGYETAPDDTAIQFKRKMGTNEKYRFKTTNQEMTPIELSAMVLKELRTSHLRGDVLDAAVITVPASFNAIQAHATKQAGELAGIRQVVLLQEPIAASLAFVNKIKDKEMESGKWMVYDLGGGTFDVALIEIKNKEMRVLDHEGDNFLGGSDFDRLIVDSIILPHIMKSFHLDAGVESAFMSHSGKYHSLYRSYLRVAEDAKKSLSVSGSFEFDSLLFVDSEGDQTDVPALIMTRSEFEKLVRPAIDQTAALMKKIIVRNSLGKGDVKFVLMVGGSTYIPYVRSRVSELLDIRARYDIDPVTAIAIGAAFYAATKVITADQSVGQQSGEDAPISIKATYERFSAESEEMFAARISGDISGLSYRIIRKDGGYDSGLKTLVSRINEDLPLERDAYNIFKLSILSADGKEIKTNLNEITIAHGKYRVIGQPLPEDINIQVDEESGGTGQINIFPKNQILPHRRSTQRPATKTIIKGSTGFIHINVIEGSHRDPPETCVLIGSLIIEGRHLTSDIRKGMTITVSLEMSEDRTIKASAVIEELDDLRFEKIFQPQAREVHMEVVRKYSEDLTTTLNRELEASSKAELFEVAKKLTTLKKDAEIATMEAQNTTNDDDGVARYQIQDRLRHIARDMHHTLSESRHAELLDQLTKVKDDTEKVVMKNGNDLDKQRFGDASRTALRAVAERNIAAMKRVISEIEDIGWRIRWRTPDFLKYVFEDLTVTNVARLNQPDKVRLLTDSGKAALAAKDWDKLRQVNNELIELMPSAERNKTSYTTGIG